MNVQIVNTMLEWMKTILKLIILFKTLAAEQPAVEEVEMVEPPAVEEVEMVEPTLPPPQSRGPMGHPRAPQAAAPREGIHDGLDFQILPECGRESERLSTQIKR